MSDVVAPLPPLPSVAIPRAFSFEELDSDETTTDSESTPDSESAIRIQQQLASATMPHKQCTPFLHRYACCRSRTGHGTSKCSCTSHSTVTLQGAAIHA